jgi:DNA sulfur modification protein DndC
LFDKFERAFGKHFYDDEQDALSRARNIVDERELQRKKREGQMAMRSAGPASTFDSCTEQI